MRGDVGVRTHVCSCTETSRCVCDVTVKTVSGRNSQTAPLYTEPPVWKVPPPCGEVVLSQNWRRAYKCVTGRETLSCGTVLTSMVFCSRRDALPASDTEEDSREDVMSLLGHRRCLQHLNWSFLSRWVRSETDYVVPDCVLSVCEVQSVLRSCILVHSVAYL